MMESKDVLKLINEEIKARRNTPMSGNSDLEIRARKHGQLLALSYIKDSIIKG